MDNLRIVPFQLPLNIMNKLENVFKKFNLNYGSADLMYCDNEYYFLEINPTGQVSFINNACNYNLENKVAQILKNGR
jgi:glutathione synthase/RimK-type ligase-like ATP-grasp enzyme